MKAALFAVRTVHHRAVAHRYVALQGAGVALIGVQHSSVLYVAALAHRNGFDVAAQHRAKPYRSLRRHAHPPDDVGARGDKGAGVNLRAVVT